MAPVRYLLLALFCRVIADHCRSCAVVSRTAVAATGVISSAGASGFGVASHPAGAAPCGRSSRRWLRCPRKWRSAGLVVGCGCLSSPEWERALAGRTEAAGSVPGLAWTRVLPGSRKVLASMHTIEIVSSSWRWIGHHGFRFEISEALEKSGAFLLAPIYLRFFAFVIHRRSRPYAEMATGGILASVKIGLSCHLTASRKPRAWRFYYREYWRELCPASPLFIGCRKTPSTASANTSFY